VSNDALSAAWRAGGLKAGPKAVLAILADHAGDHATEDWTCFPSVERIAEFGSMDVKSVERHLKALVLAKWVRCTRLRVTSGKFKGRLRGYRFRLNRQKLMEAFIEWERRRKAAVQEEPWAWDEGDEDPLEPADNLSDGPSDNLSGAIRQSAPEPSDKLSDQEPSLEPSNKPSGCAREGFAGSAVKALSRSEVRRLFDETGFAYPAKGRKATQWPRARKAFERAALVWGAERIKAAAMAYAADPDVLAMNFIPAFHTWLEEEIFKSFLPPGAAAAGVTSVGDWPGPAAVRDAVIAATAGSPSAWIVQLLDEAQWRAAGKLVVCKTDKRAERLAEEMAVRLAALGVRIVGPGATATADLFEGAK
jgi:hypothetical protein